MNLGRIDPRQQIIQRLPVCQLPEAKYVQINQNKPRANQRAVMKREPSQVEKWAPNPIQRKGKVPTGEEREGDKTEVMSWCPLRAKSGGRADPGQDPTSHYTGNQSTFLGDNGYTVFNIFTRTQRGPLPGHESIKPKDPKAPCFNKIYHWGFEDKVFHGS